MAKKKVCKDCYPNGPDPWTKVANYRPAKFPGPRCYTHHKKVVADRKEAAHEAMVLKVYGLKAGQYRQIYDFQDGVCYICQRAKGLVKMLSVDHDHKTGYVRGLLCGPCNKILGHFRDDAELAFRVVTYLKRPPAFDIVGKAKPDAS